MSGAFIEIRDFISFWQDCGADPYNSYNKLQYKGKHKIKPWCREIDKECNASNCPEFKKHIEEAKRLFKDAIKQAKEE